MSQTRVPMASQKKPQPRIATTSGNNAADNEQEPTRHSIDGADQNHTEQHENPTYDPTNVSTPSAPEPPTARDYVRLEGTNYGHSYSARQNSYATPLAATLLARFNKDDPREQPAEHYVFRDLQFERYGRI